MGLDNDKNGDPRSGNMDIDSKTTTEILRAAQSDDLRGRKELSEEYRAAVEASGPPKPKQPRPIVILGAGGIVRAAHLPAYAKAGFPVVAIADSVPEKAALLAAEIPRSVAGGELVR